MMLSRSSDRQRIVVKSLYRWCLRHASGAFEIASSCHSEPAPRVADYFLVEFRIPNAYAHAPCRSMVFHVAHGSQSNLPAGSNGNRSFSAAGWQLPYVADLSPAIKANHGVKASEPGRLSHRTSSSACESVFKGEPVGSTVTTAGSHGLNNTVPCPPGSTLVVDLRQSSRDISLAVNEDPSKLMFVSWPDGENAHVQKPIPERLVIAPARQGSPLVLHIPPRYCNLEVYTAGGKVHVAAVKEGTLAVDSGGGDITIDSMAGTFAELQSRGGHISGKITAGKVYINSDTHDGRGSGNVNLKKLLSKEAVILTRDLEDDAIPAVLAYPDAAWGDVKVTALYSDEAHIRTGGTGVSIGTLSCSQDGSLLTDGGPVSIDCLDGTMRIISGGGKVDVALQKNVATIHVNSMPKFDESDPVSVAAASHGGAIHCQVDPHVQALTALQCGDLNIDELLPFKVLGVKEKLIKGRLGPLPDTIPRAAPAASSATQSSEAFPDADRSSPLPVAPEPPASTQAPAGSTSTTVASSAESSASSHVPAGYENAMSEAHSEAHPSEYGQSAVAASAAGRDAAAAEAAAVADPAVMKHIVLDAGDNGAVRLTASSWADTVRSRFLGSKA